MPSIPPHLHGAARGRYVHGRTVYRSMRSDATTLVCRQCFSAKPADEFRRRRPGHDQRILQCRSCHAQAERLRRRAKRSRAARQAVNRTLSRLKRAKSERQVEVVCEEMIKGFGGITGFVHSWRVILARDLDMGGFAALRHIDAVLRLIQHCEARQRGAFEDLAQGGTA